MPKRRTRFKCGLIRLGEWLCSIGLGLRYIEIKPTEETTNFQFNQFKVKEASQFFSFPSILLSFFSLSQHSNTTLKLK